MNIVNLISEPEHIPLLARWHHDEWSHLYPGQSLDDRISKMQQYLFDELIPSTYVAKEGDVVLGSAALIDHDMDSNLHLSPWLASVFVNPDHREKGVGSTLVENVVNAARDGGFSRLYLFTPDRVSFYSRLGWSVLHSETYHGAEVTVMEFILNDR